MVGDLMKQFLGIDVDAETLKDLDRMSLMLEDLQDKLKNSAGRKRTEKEEAEINKLKAEFRKIAGETMREMYGYYNTETGSSLIGQQPLS